MTRTEKLLAELIALPSINPAFVPSDGTSARQARLHLISAWQADFEGACRILARFGVFVMPLWRAPGRYTLNDSKALPFLYQATGELT